MKSCKDLEYFGGKIKKCTCGKTFIPSDEWVYKISKYGKIKYFCSYTCWRKAGGGNEKYQTIVR